MTRSLNGQTSKGQALMNYGVTALTIEPLSKRTKQISSSILTWAMFSGPYQHVSGSGFKKGVFCDVLMLEASHLEIPTEWQLVIEGLSFPSLLSPLSCLSTLSRQGLLASFETILYEMVRTSTLEAVLIFLLIWLNCSSKANYVLNGLISFFYSVWLLYILISWRLCPSFLFLSCIWILFHCIITDCHSLSSESPVTLQLIDI